MGIRKRRFYTETEKSLMWDRWQKGDSMNEIGTRHLEHPAFLLDDFGIAMFAVVWAFQKLPARPIASGSSRWGNIR